VRLGRRLITAVAALAVLVPALPAQAVDAGDIVLSFVDSLTNAPIGVGGYAYLYRDGEPVFVDGDYVGAPVSGSTARFAAAKVGSDRDDLSIYAEFSSASTGPIYRSLEYVAITGAAAQSLPVSSWLGSIRLVERRNNTDQPAAATSVGVVDATTRDWYSLSDLTMRETNGYGRFAFDLPVGDYSLEFDGRTVGFGASTATYPWAQLSVSVVDIGGERVLIDSEDRRIQTIRRLPAAPVLTTVGLGADVPEGVEPIALKGDQIQDRYDARALSSNGLYSAEWNLGSRTLVVEEVVSGTQVQYDLGAAHPSADLGNSPLAISNDGGTVVSALSSSEGAAVVRWTLSACAVDVASPACAEDLSATLGDLTGLDPLESETVDYGLAASEDLAVIQLTATVSSDEVPRGIVRILSDAGVASSGIVYGGAATASRSACGSLLGAAVSTDGSTAVFTSADTGCMGRMFTWSSAEPLDYSTEIVPVESVFGAYPPTSPVLSPDGSKVAVRASVPGKVSVALNVLVLSTNVSGPTRVALVDRGSSAGEPGGLSTAIPVAVDDDGTVAVWVDPFERVEDPWDPSDYGVIGTGRTILEIEPVAVGSAPLEIVTQGSVDEQLPTPTVTVTTTKLGTSGEVLRGSTVGISVAAPQAEAVTGQLQCTGCAAPVPLTFAAASAGVFTAQASVPTGTTSLDAVVVEATAAGYRSATGRAAGLPLTVASRYRVTLTGSGVGAGAGEQLRTARLVATRSGSATTFTSAAIGTSTQITFDVPSASDGVRLTAANGELLGVLALAAVPGGEVTGTLQVRQRVGLRVRVPQAERGDLKEAPFELGSLTATVTGPDGATVGTYPVTDSGIADVGRVPAGVAYTISVILQEWARGPGVDDWASSEAVTYTPQAGASGDVRTAVVNLAAVSKAPAVFNVTSRRVIGDSEGAVSPLPLAEVVLVGKTRSDGVRMSQTWRGTSDGNGALTLAGVPAGTFSATVRGARAFATLDVTIPAPAARVTQELRAKTDEPIEIPIIVEVGTRPDEVAVVRADWRNFVHYHLRLTGQIIPSEPDDIETSGTAILARPGEYTLCGSGREANILVDPCVKFEVDVNGNSVIIGADGQRTPGTPRLRIAPVAALEVTSITGLGTAALRGATVSVNGGAPEALLPWRVAPTAPVGDAPGSPGLIALPAAGEVTVTLYSTDGRETAVTTTVTADEVKAIIPRFNADNDVLAGASQIVAAGGLVVPGTPTPVRYQVVAGRTALTNASLALQLPPGLAVRERSVIVGGTPVTGATTQISLGTIAAGASREVSLLLDSAATVSGAQVIGGEVVAGSRRATLPVAYLTFGAVTLDAPSTTRGRTIIVSGRAAPQVQVEIRDRDSGLPFAVTTTSATGSYQVSVTLPEVAVPTEYTLRAHVVGSSPELVSSPRLVAYDPSGVQITSVTLRQVNPANAEDTRSLTGDPRNGIMRAPFVWVPGHIPSVSFTVDDPSRVRKAVVLMGSTAAVAVRRGSIFTATFPASIDAGPVDIRLDVSAPRVNEWASTSESAIIAALPPQMRTPVIHSTLVPNGSRGQLRYVAPDGSITVVDSTLTIRRAPAGAKAGVVAFPVSPYEDGRMASTGGLKLIVNIPYAGDPLAATESAGRSKGRSVATAMWQGTVNIVKGDATSLGSLATIDGYIPQTNFEGGAFAFLSLDGLAGAMTSNGFSKKVMDFTDEVTQYCADYPEVATALYQKIDHLLKLARWGSAWYGPLYSLITLPVKNPVFAAVAGGIGSYYGKQYDAALEERLDLLRPQLDFCKQLRNQQQRWDAKHDAVRDALNGVPDGGVVAAPVYIYDPSGYVYEAVRSNRIPGALATLFDYTDVVPGRAPIKWDAVPYGQVNDLITNGIGRYGWDVPPGLWRVMITKSGYETAYSEIVEVLPPQLEVDIGLVSTRAPKVASIAFARDGTVRVTFSQYMTVESMKRAISAAATARVKGAKGVRTVRFRFGEAAGEGKGAGLRVDPYAPIARNGALPFVSRSLILKPNAKIPKGTKVTIRIAKGAVAYTGKVLPAQKARVLTAR
jgi:hypothetical protein